MRNDMLETTETFELTTLNTLAWDSWFQNKRPTVMTHIASLLVTPKIQPARQLKIATTLHDAYRRHKHLHTHMVQLNTQCATHSLTVTCSNPHINIDKTN